MRFLIYNTETLYVEKRFDTLGGAKASLTRKYSKGRNGHLMAVTDVETFNNEIDYEVETRNILNPEAGVIMIRKSLKGTACDPGTERYHTM